MILYLQNRIIFKREASSKFYPERSKNFCKDTRGIALLHSKFCKAIGCGCVGLLNLDFTADVFPRVIKNILFLRTTLFGCAGYSVNDYVTAKMEVVTT